MYCDLFFPFFLIMHIWYNSLQSTQLSLLSVQCPRSKSRGGTYWSCRICPHESHAQSRHTGEEESKLTGHPSKVKLRTKDNIPSLQSHKTSHEIHCLVVEKDVQPDLGCLVNCQVRELLVPGV